MFPLFVVEIGVKAVMVKYNLDQHIFATHICQMSVS